MPGADGAVSGKRLKIGPQRKSVDAWFLLIIIIIMYGTSSTLMIVDQLRKLILVTIAIQSLHALVDADPLKPGNVILLQLSKARVLHRFLSLPGIFFFLQHLKEPLPHDVRVNERPFVRPLHLRLPQVPTQLLRLPRQPRRSRWGS